MAQDNPQKLIDQFFSLYETNPYAAVDYIFDTNPWIKEAAEQLDDVKTQLEDTLDVVGKYEGYSLISEKATGGHLMQYVFMVRYDRQPLRFILLFYKPSSEWRLHHFSFDDDMEEELRAVEG